MMNNYDIGNFIGMKRREKNLTQEQLAEQLGVSNKTVSKWETGKCLPDYAVIDLLCKELDISISELLEGKKSDCVSVIDNEQYRLLLYKTQQMENKMHKMEKEKSASVATGITFGSALAMVISYVNWHSVGWAILHGILSWGYVLYYIIRY
ncbi:MAG: helix-turn-helix domain-containing protein [Clostridia bacterium]|nr:helix-turn-helix domain-containing protein [Clostridia bacterium]